MHRVAILVGLAALSALAGCGRMAPLEPAPGHALPVKPRMAQSTPTAEELLTPPAYAAPQRVDELMKRSVTRRTDPFNLPPPGGEAPTLPVQELNKPQPSNQAGPVTPSGD